MGDLQGPLLAALYDAIVDGAALEAAVDKLAQGFGCHSSSIVSFDPLSPQTAVALSTGAFDREAKRTYEADFAALDPAPAAFAAAPSGTVLASNRFLSADYLRRSPMLHEFLRPRGIEETIGGTVSSGGGRFGFLTFHRGADREPFSDEELGQVERMLPHVNRALQLRRAFAKLETTAAFLADVIDRLSVGVVIVHGDGSIIHVNTAARLIAARGDGLWFDRKGILRAADVTAESLLAYYGSEVRSGGAGKIVRVPRRDGLRHYAVLVAPLPPGTSFTNPSQAARGALYFIHDPDSRINTNSETIATIFAIPPASAQLVAALIEGDDPKNYAERKNISYETVRYHLKTAFERTGARTQGRLLQMVTRALTELRHR